MLGFGLYFARALVAACWKFWRTTLASLAWNPPALLEHMATSDDVAYCPLAFGYASYARPGFRPRQLRFAPAPMDAGGVPRGMLGGAGIVMFGMVAATGIRILADVDYRSSRHNLFIVAISIGFGMIPLVSPNFFKNLPHDLHPLLESGILLSALVAVTLNAFFNGVSGKTAAEVDAAAAAATATH